MNFHTYFYGTVAIVSNFVEIMNLGSPQLINQMSRMLALGNGTNNTFIFFTFAITSRAHLPKWWSMLISVFPLIFDINVLNNRILPGFLLIQKGNGNSNMFSKFQHPSMQIFFFFKMANLCFLKTEKVASTPLTLWLWRLTLPPSKVLPPILFSWKWLQRM